MERYVKVQKGTTPLGFGGGGTNEKDNEKDKSIGQKQGNTASKGIAAAHRTFRKSARNHSKTNFSQRVIQQPMN